MSKALWLVCMTLAAQPAADIAKNIVEIRPTGNEAPLRLDLDQVMRVLRVPGLTVAIVDNFRIVATKTYGTIEAGSQKPVTPTTPFQAGSISKPVAAAGALQLVEQGK